MTNINQFLNQIINGDCLDVMKQMPNESVDLTITSPPYNVSGATTGNHKHKSPGLVNGYDGYCDNLPHEEYVAKQKEVLAELFRIIKPDGAIFYNHKNRLYKDKAMFDPARELIEPLPIRQMIIWQRAGTQHFSPYYFGHSYELIYMIAKPDFKLLKGANGFCDVWNIPQEIRKDKEHPAPFPIELPKRIIKSTDKQIIFDPFMGSGTTGCAAVMLGRNYIGVEQSEKYCRDATERIKGLSTGVGTNFNL